MRISFPPSIYVFERFCVFKPFISQHPTLGVNKAPFAVMLDPCQSVYKPFIFTAGQETDKSNRNAVFGGYHQFTGFVDESPILACLHRCQAIVTENFRVWIFGLDN